MKAVPYHCSLLRYRYNAEGSLCHPGKPSSLSVLLWVSQEGVPRVPRGRATRRVYAIFSQTVAVSTQNLRVLLPATLNDDTLMQPWYAHQGIVVGVDVDHVIMSPSRFRKQNSALLFVVEMRV